MSLSQIEREQVTVKTGRKPTSTMWRWTALAATM